jgi:hypothetical protein
MALAVFLITAAMASAMTVYTDRAGFESSGLIASQYGFQEFAPDALTYLPNPHTQAGVTYVTGDNLVVGANYDPYRPISNVFCSNLLGPIGGLVATSPARNMLGMDLGYLAGPSSVDLAVSTNLGEYHYNALAVPPAGEALMFRGFVAGADEYFTAFTVSARDDGSAAVIDNVTLGDAYTSVIPEPLTLASLAGAIAGLGGYLRKRLAR